MSLKRGKNRDRGKFFRQEILPDCLNEEAVSDKAADYQRNFSENAKIRCMLRSDSSKGYIPGNGVDWIILARSQRQA